MADQIQLFVKSINGMSGRGLLFSLFFSLLFFLLCLCGLLALRVVVAMSRSGQRQRACAWSLVPLPFCRKKKARKKKKKEKAEREDAQDELDERACCKCVVCFGRFGDMR